MSMDDPKSTSPHPCPMSSKTRRVSEHLIEVGLAASYLGNTSTYERTWLSGPRPLVSG